MEWMPQMFLRFLNRVFNPAPKPRKLNAASLVDKYGFKVAALYVLAAMEQKS